MNPIQAKAAANAANIEQVLVSGDLARLSPAERVSFYNMVCSSLGLNPLTKPFEYVTLNGKLTLYAKKDCTDQLRKIHGVSIIKIEKDLVEGIAMVTAYARDKSGKEDADMGAVDVTGLKGEKLANAMMKSITKAKRRVTLSICGLGILDETEVETIRDANPTKAQEVNALLSSKPDERDEPPPEPDFITEAAAEMPFQPGEYVIQIGQRYRGKALKDLSRDTVAGYLDWVKANVTTKSPATLEFIERAEAYLEGA